MTKRFIVLLALLLFVVIPTRAYAVDDPTDIDIKAVTCYRSLIDDTDILCIVYYVIDYSTMPTDNANINFVLRFMESSTERSSASPTVYAGTISSTTTPPAQGYGEGVASFYWNAYETNVSPGMTWNAASGTYRVIIQGNPDIFTDSTIPSAEHTAISWRTPVEQATDLLRADIIALAKNLEADWVNNEITLQTSLANQNVLTLVGEIYFNAAIPNLGLMAPDIYESRLLVPIYKERDYSTSTSKAYEDFWIGSALENSFDSLAELFNVPSLLARTGILFAVGTLAFWIAKSISERVEWGFIVMFGITLPLGVVVGLTAMALILTIGMLSVMLMAWVYIAT